MIDIDTLTTSFPLTGDVKACCSEEEEEYDKDNKMMISILLSQQGRQCCGPLNQNATQI